MLQPIVENIPEELKLVPQWVCWIAKKRDNGKTDKIPINPNTGHMAKVSDKSTWGSFYDATNAYKSGKFAGIGFVLTPDDNFCGIDIDNCIDDLGIIQPAAWEIVNQLSSYAEISPSGHGLRIFTIAKLTASGRRKGNYEIYTDGRFLTVTGHKITDEPIRERQAEVELFHTTYIKKAPAAAKRETAATADITLSDGELLDKARRAKNGNLFSLLFDRGDWRAGGYPSQSEADQALANILAFWFGRDHSRIEAIFRTSGLYRRNATNILPTLMTLFRRRLMTVKRFTLVL